MQLRLKRFRLLACGATAVGVIAMGAMAIGAPSGGAAITHTEVTMGLHPGATPNFIFPLMTFGHCSTVDISQFQNLLYRNVYSYGAGAGVQTAVSLNEKMSIGDPPVYSKTGKTVTISLKDYKWSNGETVDSTDVVFYFNLLRVSATEYCYHFKYTTLSIPTIVSSVRTDGPSKVIVTLKKKVSAHWFTYDELSQITPLPMAWDVTSLTGAPNSGGCAKAPYGTADAKCKAVFDFLSTESGYNPTKPTTKITALSSYASSPIWKVVDGPFRLKSFGPTAPAVFVPNPTYSGPNKPKLKEFVEKPFSSTTAEFNALVGGTIQVGFLPTADITSNAKPARTVETEPTTGANNSRLTSSYNLKKTWLEQITYFPLNYKSTGDGGEAGLIFKQAYIRQAIQLGVDQPAYIKALFKGYGVPDYGPIPPTPSNPYLDKTEKHNPFAYNPAKGKTLLADHGWKVVPGGTDTCQKPGTGPKDCGAGIKKGTRLAFTYLVATTPPLPTMAAAEKGTWSTEGINVRITKGTFDTIISRSTSCAKGCAWEMGNWGGGWIFSPDYYPTGEELFAPGADANAGLWTTSTSNGFIKQTDTSTVTLTKYEDYLTTATPVIWEPVAGGTLLEVHKGLENVAFNAFSYITAATWYWKS